MTKFFAGTSDKRRLFITALVSAALISACGGGNSGSATPPAPPAPPVDGPAWSGLGRDAQHSAISGIAAQNLKTISWKTSMDLAPQYRADGALLAHYGSPVITSHNTVIVPVKTTAAGDFRFEARSGGNGALIWSASSDYILPAHNWVPSFNLALNANNRLYAPGAGGKLLLRDNADSAQGTIQNAVFYGANFYNAAPATYDANVAINTPLTIDSKGNVFFGFIVTGPTPLNLISGIARIGADGSNTWISAAAAAGDAAIAKPAMNSAPALSPDGSTLYVAVNTAQIPRTIQTGYLLALDSTSLAAKNKTVLIDPSTLAPAWIPDDGTSSPTVGPDGAVYFGVLESNPPSHNARGWLLSFNASLVSAGRAPGSFGWDDTPSIVPASMVSSYTGASPYLLMSKYNNYNGIGTGDGLNRIAVLDPYAVQNDAISGLPAMREVITVLGPTFESGTSGPVKEWCINTAAVDPFTKSILVNSEDGYLYRWSMESNTFTQRIQLTSGVAESYTPTAIGADGAVYVVNNAVLFSITN
jgi:hypothetical protein